MILLGVISKADPEGHGAQLLGLPQHVHLDLMGLAFLALILGGQHVRQGLEDVLALVLVVGEQIDLGDVLAGLVLDHQLEAGVALGHRGGFGNRRGLLGGGGLLSGLFGGGHGDLGELGAGGLYGSRVSGGRAFVHGIPLIHHVALLQGLGQILQGFGIAVVVLDLDVVLILGVLQGDLVGQVAVAVGFEQVLDGIGDVRAVVELHVQVIVVGVGAEEALEEVHTAFLGLAGHEGRHLFTGSGVEVVDHVVVGVGIAAFLIEAEVHDVLAGLVLQLDGEELVSGIDVVGSLAYGYRSIHGRLVLGLVLQHHLPGGRIDAVLHGDLGVHLQLSKVLLGLGAVREDHQQLLGRAGFPDDVDVLLIVGLVRVLILPAGGHHAVAFVAARGVDVHLVDGDAGLILDVQTQGYIGRLRRFRLFGGLGGLFGGLLRSRRLGSDGGWGFSGLGRSAGDDPQDHQQDENERK